jgi:hypothetical protein
MFSELITFIENINVKLIISSLKAIDFKNAKIIL